MTCSLLNAEGIGSVRLASQNPKEMPIIELGYHNLNDIYGLGIVLDVADKVIKTSEFRRIGPRNVSLLSILRLGGKAQKIIMRTFSWSKLQPLFAHSSLLRSLVFRRYSSMAQQKDLEAILRQCVVSGHHLHGSCPMGSDRNPRAVVDRQFRVHGIDNLFIADASVIPIQLRTNTHVPTIMIGEKLAEYLTV
jgi:choline dehydrogenase-like flavoprotein